MTITELLVADHERIAGLLARAREGDLAAYEALRGALLRHIGLEEKILLPALAARGVDAGALGAQLRVDHGALAAMFVPSPSPELLARIAELLSVHDPLEEGPHGLYARADDALAGDADLLERLRRAPTPPLAKHFDGPRSHAAIAELVRRAMEQRGAR